MQSEVKYCITTSLPPTDLQSSGHMLQKAKEGGVMHSCINTNTWQVSPALMCHCSTHLHLQIACSHPWQRTCLHKCCTGGSPGKVMEIWYQKRAFLKHPLAFRQNRIATVLHILPHVRPLLPSVKPTAFLLGGRPTQTKCSLYVKATN